MSTKSKTDEKPSGKREWEILVTDPRRCIGCEICEVACSFAHDKNFNALNSRINRVRIEPIANYVINCLKCKDPDCVEACPLGALSQKEENGIILVDQNVCDGCGACVKACPYGAITIHNEQNKAIMCDLCEGTGYEIPQCVDICPKEAIFIEKIDADLDEDRLVSVKKILDRGFPGGEDGCTLN